MTKEEAIHVLIQVAIVAQAKGVLTLEDAVLVKQSIDLLKPTLASLPSEIQVEDAVLLD